MKFVFKKVIDDTSVVLHIYKGKLSKTAYSEYVNSIFRNVKNMYGIHLVEEVLMEKSVHYLFRISSYKLQVDINKIIDIEFKNIKEVKMPMGKAIYSLWSEVSLKDELKRRGLNAKEYSNLGSDGLVELLEKLDKTSSKRKRRIKPKQKTQEKKMSVKVKDLTLTGVRNMTDKELISVCKKLKVKPSKKRKNMIIRIKKHMLAEGNNDFFDVGKYAKKKSKGKSKSKSADSGKAKGKKKGGGGKKKEKKWERNLRLAKEQDNEVWEKIILLRKQKRELKESYKFGTDAEREKFRNKYKGKGTNWNKKLKNADIWETGMQLLSNFEKYLILNAKGAKRKKMISAFTKNYEQSKKLTAEIRELLKLKKKGVKKLKDADVDIGKAKGRTKVKAKASKKSAKKISKKKTTKKKSAKKTKTKGKGKKKK